MFIYKSTLQKSNLNRFTCWKIFPSSRRPRRAYKIFWFPQIFRCLNDCGSNGNLILANWHLMCSDTHISSYSFNTHIPSAVSAHTFQRSFNTHISSTVSIHTFQVQFQHTHFRCSFNTHIPGAVWTHKFQVQFQHISTQFQQHSFNTHISGAVSTHTFQHAVSTRTFQVQFQHTHFSYSSDKHISSTNFNTHI